MGILRNRTEVLLVLGAATTFAALLGMEAMGEDGADLVDLADDALQFALLVGCSVASTLLAQRVAVRTAEETRSLRAEIDALRERRATFQHGIEHHLAALGAAIEAQFRTWQFTVAEEEVGLLLLKGFSHKEIARLRQASEATVRQQASALYRKAGMTGRAALSAHFLDQLLLRPTPDEPVGPASVR